MSSIVKYLFSVCIFSIGFFAAGCHFKSGQDDGTVSYIPVDSSTLWNAKGSDQPIVSLTTYVLDTGRIYILRGNKLYADTIVYMGDTISVTTDQADFFDMRYYPVEWHGIHGYMRGTDMGECLRSDFDHDGKMDMVLYGFEAYRNDTPEESAVHPVLVRFVTSAGVLKADVRSTATRSLDLKEVPDVRLSGHVHVYEMRGGIEACGYPQYHLIIAYGNGKGELIHRSVTNIDSGLGDYCQFYYPADSTHRVDTIYISHRLAQPLSETDDTTIVEHTADSTILYLHQGAWGEKNYKLDPKSN